MAYDDVIIVGGGIVGLATAMELLGQQPGLALAVLEKEPQVAAHQTAHNSGVIHSGLYYRPGSLKAQTCVAGATLLIEFCRQHAIPFEMCGKLVVATQASELPRLQTLYERGIANGVAGLRRIGPEEIRELEPHARGIAALHVPSAGLVDYGQVAEAMASVIRQRGGVIQCSTRVTGIARRGSEWVLQTTQGECRAPYVITCGGLQSDRLARSADGSSDVQIVPFRGEYYDVRPQRRYLVKHMIYPVPDPAMPFLGVHFTRSIHGGVHAGPNAVLAWKREGYRKTDVSLPDLASMLGFPGFWRMSRTQWRTGLHEAYRSWSRRAFVRALQRLVPEIQERDVTPNGSGVRAQAVDQQGRLLDDFDIATAINAVHVRNVPSPAATASIRIGQHITQMVASAFGLDAGVRLDAARTGRLQ
ncbi:MAG: L-2-hydroxyglutarate oxidase [Candidatus Omnitrophica bacterium]|nr:L-2-hydroxyglutarate oxidase [Candidatus Omnitrophota bacterium]